MAAAVARTNLLAYGDTESVDLIYLDPPFNSNASYNILFADRGEAAAAHVQAFGDTWKWDLRAAATYQAFRTLVGTSDVLAYLSMMAPRLVELHRVLGISSQHPDVLVGSAGRASSLATTRTMRTVA